MKNEAKLIITLPFFISLKAFTKKKIKKLFLVNASLEKNILEKTQVATGDCFY